MKLGQPDLLHFHAGADSPGRPLATANTAKGAIIGAFLLKSLT
jgi:hypothetical protein